MRIIYLRFNPYHKVHIKSQANKIYYSNNKEFILTYVYMCVLKYEIHA